MKWICFALIFPINAKHEFLHSEVLYLGPIEAGRTDADQMLFQVLSRSWVIVLLGSISCTGLLNSPPKTSDQSKSPCISFTKIDTRYHCFIIACLLLEVKDVDNRTFLRSCVKPSKMVTLWKTRIGILKLANSHPKERTWMMDSWPSPPNSCSYSQGKPAC